MPVSAPASPKLLNQSLWRAGGAQQSGLTCPLAVLPFVGADGVPPGPPLPLPLSCSCKGQRPFWNHPARWVPPSMGKTSDTSLTSPKASTGTDSANESIAQGFPVDGMKLDGSGNHTLARGFSSAFPMLLLTAHPRPLAQEPSSQILLLGNAIHSS